MKGYSILAVSTVFLVALASPSQAALLSYFDFEGDAGDRVGTNHGRVTGAKLTDDGYNGGQAYSFYGNGYIEVALNIGPTALPQLTMGAWVKSACARPTQQIISHDNGGYDRSLGIDARGGSAGWSSFSGSGRVLGSYPVVTGEWTFVAAIYDQDAGNVTLYKDGNYMSEAGSFGNGYSSLRIGKNPGYGEHFKGVIDEVFFFGKALSIAELDAIRKDGVFSPEPVPEPATMLLFGTGLAGLAGARLRRNKK